MTGADVNDPLFWALAVPAVLLAGVSKGGFGSGAAFAATPLLALALPPAVAVGLMLPLLMTMDATGLRAYWRRWSWPDARALMIGAVPGVALGALIYRAADPDAFRLAIGLVALGFVAFQMARSRGWAPAGGGPLKPRRAGFWGAVAGLTSFVSHAGGPPAAVHLLGRRLDKTTYQATTVLVFWWINLLKVGPYLWLGLIDAQTASAGLWLLPVAVGGMLLGVRAHHWLREDLFFRLVHVFLVATGTKLVWDGIAGLLGG